MLLKYSSSRFISELMEKCLFSDKPHKEGLDNYSRFHAVSVCLKCMSFNFKHLVGITDAFSSMYQYIFVQMVKDLGKFNSNQRLSRACIVHLAIKKTNWSYVKTMSCSGSHLGITINIKNTKYVKDLPMIDAQ